MSDNYIAAMDEDRRINLVLKSLHILLICDWLNMHELGNFDVAMSNHRRREHWLNLLEADGSQAANKWLQSHASMRWVITRCICISHFLVNPKHCTKVFDSTFEAAGANRRESASITGALEKKNWSWKRIKDLVLSTTLYRRGRARDISVSGLAIVCGQLKSINLGGCVGITDIGVSGLSNGCGQLRSINLRGCTRIADIGVSALGHGCGQLQSVNLGGCHMITDTSVSALGHGCSQLRSINLFGCSSITDVGVLALAHGCSQLKSINLGGCHMITDTSVSALAHECGQLKSINLGGCHMITDIGVSALAHGCGQLLSIDLRGCTDITDIGVSALAHGCSQLQSINIMNCWGFTYTGVSALAVVTYSRLFSVDAIEPQKSVHQS